jgi:hypothetical protein
MGVPTSEVGYTAAMPRREDHEVHKDMWWHWTKSPQGHVVTLDKNIHNILPIYGSIQFLNTANSSDIPLLERHIDLSQYIPYDNS